MAERKHSWGGGGDKPLLSASVDVVTRACCCHPSFSSATDAWAWGTAPLPQAPPARQCSSSTQLEAGASAAKLKWVLWLQTPRPSDLFCLLVFFYCLFPLCYHLEGKFLVN